MDHLYRKFWFALVPSRLTDRPAWLLLLLVCLFATACSAAPSDPPETPAPVITVPPVDHRQPTTTPASPASASSPTPASSQPPASPVAVTQAAPSTLPASSPTPAATPTPAPPRDCQEQAVFVEDVTIPDHTLMEPGEKFTKTWRVKNSGTCDWGAGYLVVLADGDIMNGNLNSPLNVSIPAGQTGDISLDLRAPERGGEHTGYWKIQNPEGLQFGAGVPPNIAFWVTINVRFFDTNAADLAHGGASNPAPTGNPPASEGCSPQTNPAYENQILDLINSARAANGLGPLTISAQLSAAAQSHSQDMACNNFVDHHGSNGATWQDRAADQGYSNAASAHENIYVGNPSFGGTPDGAFTWWMNSAVHRANILSPDVSEIGIGYAYNPNSDYGGYYTTVFARP